MQSVYFCLKSNVLLSRPERDEEAVKKRKQEKKKISAEAKVHNYTVWVKYVSMRQKFTVWQKKPFESGFLLVHAYLRS